MQKAKIIVAVRKRPLFEKQKVKGYNDIITVTNGNRVIVSEMKQKVDLTKYMQESVFNFDHAFDQDSSNQQIYSHIISPLIDSAFQGAKVSCFAYGQTGSGKTYTMNGVMNKNLPGLYSLGAYDIFQKLQQPQFSHLTIYLSFYQIYCTKLYDLLNKRTQLILRQDAKSNINVVGLSQMPIFNVEQFQSHLKVGSSQRVTSQNSANSQSSRSHAILQISLKNGKKPFGKVYFIDLAGNERGADHANQKKQTQIDGQQINKSLLQLKQCIRGLDQGKNHVPFRGSKLTMCLKDSFIGFCRTVMIGNISPCSASSQNTLNTLRYADRVKELKNNEQLTKQQLKNRQMMLPRGNNNAIKIVIQNGDDQQDIAQKKRKAFQSYGIKNQQKTNNIYHQDNLNLSSRKLSMGPINAPIKTSLINKSSSIAKDPINSQNNIISNKTISNQRVNQPKKHSQIQKQQEYFPRTNISQNNNNFASRKLNQPMQIQKSQQKTLNLNLRKNYSVVQNNQQYRTNNYMGNESYLTNNSMMEQNQFNNQNQMNKPHYISHNNYMGNKNIPMNINIPFNKINSLKNNVNSNITTNFTSYQNRRNQQKKPILPETWNQIISYFPKTNDPSIKSQLHQKLVSNLFQQQNQLINQHSNTLQTQIQKIKQQMSVIKLLEQDRSSLTSKEYAKIMYQSIDQKISQLQLLKQGLTSFMYKLDDMEQVQKSLSVQFVKRQSMGEDQQLLDDY